MEKPFVATSALDSQMAAFQAANCAEEKKGRGTVILDVRQVTLLADFFVITGGDNVNQVKAIAEAVNERLSTLGYPAQAIEGKNEGRWVLLDFGAIIIHVLQERERNFYKLEQFWNHALIVDRKLWAKE